MRLQLIYELVRKFWAGKIKLREIMIELNEEEFDEFVDSYDDHIKEYGPWIG